MSQEQSEREVSGARKSASPKEPRATNSRYLLVPVGEGHHDVEGGQEEAEVEEGVAVGDSLLFVVHSSSHSILPCRGLAVGGQNLAVLSLHQLVHLGVVGGADTVADESTGSHLDKRLQRTGHDGI